MSDPTQIGVTLCCPASHGAGVRRAESLGIRYLSAFLEAHGIPSRIVDAHCWGMDLDSTIAAVREPPPRLVGIQLLFFDQIDAAAALAQSLKHCCPDICIVAGGHVPTFSASDLLHRVPAIDAAVVGEGEISLLALANNISSSADRSKRDILSDVPGINYLADGSLISVPPAPLIPKLDDLPFPIRDSRDYTEFRHASLIGSRGCYAACTFCSVPPFFKLSRGPLWRLRSVNNLLEEMIWLSVQHGITHFSFLDDIFLGPDRRSQARACEFAEAVQTSLPFVRFAIECRTDAVRKETFECLRAAGLERVFLGLESGSDDGLAILNKRSDIPASLNAIQVLRDLGIFVAFGFINFHPESTLESLAQNVTFLESLHLCFPSRLCTRLNAYPGTPIWSELREARRLVGDTLFPTYEISAPGVEPLYQDFRTAFRERIALEEARKRAEFALSFLTVDRDRWQNQYDEACDTLSAETASRALRMILERKAGISPAVGSYAASFAAAMEPVYSAFANVRRAGHDRGAMTINQVPYE